MVPAMIGDSQQCSEAPGLKLVCKDNRPSSGSGRGTDGGRRTCEGGRWMGMRRSSQQDGQGAGSRRLLVRVVLPGRMITWSKSGNPNPIFDRVNVVS